MYYSDRHPPIKKYYKSYAKKGKEDTVCEEQQIIQSNQTMGV